MPRTIGGGVRPGRTGRARRKQLNAEYQRTQHAARSASMPLDREQLGSLLLHVDESVQRRGCDHTRRATDEWAAQQDIEMDRLHEGLEEFGGYCDCEVVMNVHPDDVFISVSPPADERR